MQPTFGTAGIRGLTFQEISPALAEKVARTYGTHLKQHGGKSVVIGRDTRHGAHSLELAAAAGFSAAGIDVTCCGVLPTPALAAYLTSISADGAMMITGSHTPPERIGLIVMFNDGGYLIGDVAKNIESWLHKEPSLQLYASYNEAGKIRSNSTVLEEYKSYLLKRTNLEILRQRKWKILVDAGNGTASGIAADIFHSIGADVASINDIMDGIPNRPSEPRTNTIDEARRVTQAIGADLGVCFDVDADRVVFVTSAQDTNKATVIPPDVIGVTLMEFVLQKKQGKIVLPINSSGLADLILQEKFGDSVIYCRIGQPATIEACKKHAAVFSYEESGKYYFIGEKILWTDAILATLRILEYLTTEGLTPSELLTQYPQFFTKTINNPVSLEYQDQIYQKTLERWNKNPIAGLKVIQESNIDGCRKTYEDGSWMLIRKSGTEPLIRVVADSREEQRAIELSQKGADWVQSVKRTIS